MPILGDAPVVVAHLSRATSNALRIGLTTADGTDLARAQQKGGAAVLLGLPSDGYGFQVREAEVTFWGLCPRCRQS